MAKPASFDDLPAWQREPHRLITISDRVAIDSIPGATVALGAFLDACREHGAKMNSGGDSVIVSLTDDELEQKLEQARRGWDNLQKLYTKWVQTGDVPQYGADATVRKWAKDEGLMPPEEAWRKAETEVDADAAPAVIGDLDVIKDGF